MRIELFSSKPLLSKRRWYFRIRAKNGEPIAQSEGYSRRLDAKATAESLKANLADAAIVEAV